MIRVGVVGMRHREALMYYLSVFLRILRELAQMKEQGFTTMADTRESYCNSEKCKKVTLQTKIVRVSDDVVFWQCNNCGRKVYA